MVPQPYPHGARGHRHRRAVQAARVVRHVGQQAGHAGQREVVVRRVPRGRLHHRPVPDAHLLPHRGRRPRVPRARVAGRAHGEHDPAQHPVAAERVRAHRRDGVALHPSRAGGGEMRGEDGRRASRPQARIPGQRHRGGGQGLRRRNAARAQLGRAGEERRQVRALRHAGQRVLPLRPT